MEQHNLSGIKHFIAGQIVPIVSMLPPTGLAEKQTKYVLNNCITKSKNTNTTDCQSH